MKILIAGATGAIGGVFLKYTLRRPEITKVIALTRKPLSDLHKKVENIIIPDFGDWESLDDATWQKILDSDAMIWAIGTYDLNEEVNMRYPLAFQAAFRERRQQAVGKFRFILLSGAFVETDQDRMLLFLPRQRKIKGVTEAKTLEFAERWRDVWKAFVVRPGGVLFGDSVLNNVAEWVFGRSLVVRSEELGVYVADLVVNGWSDGAVINNITIVERGRKLLREAL